MCVCVCVCAAAERRAVRRKEDNLLHAAREGDVVALSKLVSAALTVSQYFLQDFFLLFCVASCVS